MDVGAETEAYAAYFNAPAIARESEHFDTDLAKARAAMERAWLEAKPTLAAGEQANPLVAEERHGANSRPIFDPEVGCTTSNQPGGW